MKAEITAPRYTLSNSTD